MEANSNSIGGAVALKREVLEKIEQLLSKGKENIPGNPDGDTKASIEKKLGRASNRYRIMRPLTVAMGVFFTWMCIAQILHIDFFLNTFEWQNGALFFLLTLALTVSVFNLKQQMERYRLSLYLLEMVERIEK
jgi:hypothetical protein